MMNKLIPCVIGALIGAFLGPGILILLIYLYYLIFTPSVLSDGQWVLYIFKVGPMGALLGAVSGTILGFFLRDI